MNIQEVIEEAFIENLDLGEGMLEPNIRSMIYQYYTRRLNLDPIEATETTTRLIQKFAALCVGLH